MDTRDRITRISQIKEKVLMMKNPHLEIIFLKNCGHVPYVMLPDSCQMDESCPNYRHEKVFSDGTIFYHELSNVH